MGMFDDVPSMPSWLPEDPTKNAAARAGLLQLGAALLGGRGNIGQILGGGLAAGAQGYNGSLERQQQAGLAASQKQRWDLENQATQAATARQQQVQGLISGLGTPAAVQPGPEASLVTQQAPVAPQAPIASIGSLPQIGQPSPAPAPAPTAAPSAHDQALRIGTALLNGGFTAEAKPYLEAADKLKPKYSTDFKVAQGDDGKLHNYLVAEDGTFRDVGLGVKPDMVSTDLGGQVVWNDKNALTGGQSMRKTVTPGEALSSSDQAKARAQSQQHWQAEQEDANQPGKPNLTLAKQIATYRASPLGQFNLNKPWGRATMDEVMRINPDYDAAQYAPRAVALRSFAAGGKDGAAIESANTAMNHLATLRELALAQKTGNSRLFNQVANSISAQFGGAAPTNLQAAVQMVAPEVVKAVSGAGGTGEDRAHAAAALTGNGTYSPDQILGAVGTTQELFAGRLREKQRSYERGTGLKDFQETFLSPAARGLISPPAPTAGPPKLAPVASLPKKLVSPQPYADPDKEARYQTWKRSQGQ